MKDIKQGGSSTPQKPKGHVDFKSAFYFQTPVWTADAPMFLKNANKVSDKYIKKANKLLKDKLKNKILIHVDSSVRELNGVLHLFN